MLRNTTIDHLLDHLGEIRRIISNAEVVGRPVGKDRAFGTHKLADEDVERLASGAGHDATLAHVRTTGEGIPLRRSR